jgi:hypothetical protein
MAASRAACVADSRGKCFVDISSTSRSQTSRIRRDDASFGSPNSS